MAYNPASVPCDRLSNKWPIMLDPHSLGLEALQAQNDHMVTCDMHDEKLMDVADSCN